MHQERDDIQERVRERGRELQRVLLGLVFPDYLLESIKLIEVNSICLNAAV